jgi:hypothetical protein
MVQDSAATVDTPGMELVIEDAEDETPLDVPPTRRRVSTDKQDIPVETLHMRVARGTIDPQPDFQRYFVWNAT